MATLAPIDDVAQKPLLWRVTISQQLGTVKFSCTSKH